MSDINTNPSNEQIKQQLLDTAKIIVEQILNSNNPNMSLGDILSGANNSSTKKSDEMFKFFSSLKDSSIAYAYYILYPFAIILYIIVYIILLICYIITYIILYILTLSSRLSKLIGDIEFFWDVDPGIGNHLFYGKFLFIDLLDKNTYDFFSSQKNYTTQELGDEIKKIIEKINTILKNRLQKYKSIIKNLKDKQIKEEEENKALEKWKEYVANEKSNLREKISSEELITLVTTSTTIATNTGSGIKGIITFIFKYIRDWVIPILKLISLAIGFIIKYAFELFKLLIIVILSFFKSFMNFLTNMLGKWTRPFAGFMILLFILGIIILSVYLTYETDNVDLDRGSGDLSGLDAGGIGFNNNNNNNNVNRKRFTYDENTNIFDALYRLPGEIYSFMNDFTIFYNEIVKSITFFMNFSSEIMNDARNFGEESIEYSRTDNINSEGINDNIYTFDATYIRQLIDAHKDYDRLKETELYKYIKANNIDNKVVHLIKPIDINKYTNKNINQLSVNIENINGDGEYKIKCDGIFFDKSCKIKQIDGSKIENCKIIDKTPKDTDYNNILL